MPETTRLELSLTLCVLEYLRFLKPQEMSQAETIVCGLLTHLKMTAILMSSAFIYSYPLQ